MLHELVGDSWYLRPYVKFAGSPFWNDLGGRTPEESSQLTFIMMAGSVSRGS